MKKLIVVAVLFAAMVTAAFASPAGNVTDWLFGLPEDNYMEAQWYPGTGFEKFFAATGLVTGAANIGFATKLGGMYLGLKYTGHIFRQVNIRYTEVSKPTESFAGSPGKTFKDYGTGITITGTNRPDHNISVLLGIADMGFLIGVNTDYQSFKDSDLRIGTNNYRSYEAEYGYITPSIKWGMAKDLTANGIRPAVSFSFTMNKDQEKSELYALTPLFNYTVYGTTITRSADSNVIDLSVNLGGLTLKKLENGFSFSLDFDYSLSSTSYGENQYSWIKRTTGIPYNNVAIVNEKKKGYMYSDGVFITDYKETSHVIQPSLAASWDSDKIGLGAKLHLPVTLRSTEYISNSYDSNPTVDTTDDFKKTSTTSESYIGFAPTLKLGGQYRLVPNKFNINMGATIVLSTVSNTKEDTITIIPIADAGTEKSVVPGSTGTSSSFSVGATLFLTNNVSLDAYTGVRNSNAISIFSTTNITNFTGILLSLKF
jgi:hypothetical protein